MDVLPFRILALRKRNKMCDQGSVGEGLRDDSGSRALRKEAAREHSGVGMERQAVSVVYLPDVPVLLARIAEVSHVAEFDCLTE